MRVYARGILYLAVLFVTLGLVFGACTSDADAQRLRRNVTWSKHRINGSRVNVVRAPLRMLEALPGCRRNESCGRRDAMLPSENGKRHGALVTIGGDFVRNAQTVHAFVHDGRTLNRGIRNGDTFLLRKDGTAILGRGRDRFINDPRTEEYFGGYPQVLRNGHVPSDRGDCKNDDGPDGAFCLRQPRQGVGLSRNGQTVILIQVDGHQRGSRGMLLPELGRTARRFGAWNFLNVDGGGSSVMWIRGKGLVSNPYLGEERRVAQAISIVP